MARKKRKAAQNIPPRSSPPLSASAGKWGAALPALAALALVFAWLSLLGALSDGRLNWNDLLDGDTLRPWLMFRDLGSELTPVSGWNKPGSGMWAPDFAVLWLLYALGADFRAVAALFPLLQTALAALGWILVCERLYGKSPRRRAVVLILHALPLVLAGYRGVDVFYHQLVPLWRFGTWATMPWLLWLSLRALEPGEDDRRKTVGLALLGAAAVVAAASDLAIAAWFFAPAIFAAAALTATGRVKRADFARFAAVLLLAVPAGLWLDGALGIGEGESTRTDIAFGFSHFAAVGRVALALLGELTARNFPEMALCAAFAVVAGIRFFKALTAPKREAREFAPAFVALLVFAALVAPFFAALTRQHFGMHLDPDKLYRSSHRYFLPLFYFPLFAGWALLPWNFPALARRGVPIAAAASALLLALAAPGALAVRADGADAFASPFHRCFAQNARRLGWTGGLAGYWQSMHLAANPDAGIGRMLGAHVRRDAQGTEVLSQWLFNRHWYSGEFQFVALNGFNGRVFHTLPGAAEPGCPVERAAECIYPAHYGGVLDEAAARAAFGEPQEVVDCEGFGFFHYDPPLQFDLAPLGFPDRLKMENVPLRREGR